MKGTPLIMHTTQIQEVKKKNLHTEFSKIKNLPLPYIKSTLLPKTQTPIPIFFPKPSNPQILKPTPQKPTYKTQKKPT